MIVALDVDGPVADLHKEWYARYNRDYNDNLTESRVLTWNLHNHVKPECGTKIYEYLTQPDLYDNVPVTYGAEEGIAFLKERGNRVVFISSAPCGQMDQKYKWLLDHKFLDPNKRSHEDLFFGFDKSLLRAPILIDDGPHNLEAFQGLSVAFDAPYNQKVQKARIFRMKGWKDLPRLWEVLYG